MPASSAILASRRLSSQLPDHRSGALVTNRPEEQFAPKKPSFSRLQLYIAIRPSMAPFMSSTALLLILVGLAVLGHGLKQVLDLERLRHVAIGTDLRRPTPRVLGRSYDQDRHVDAAPLDFIGKAPPVQDRHTHVEQNERRELAIDLLQGRAPGRCRLYGVTCVDQHRLSRAHDGVIVVDDKDV